MSKQESYRTATRLMYFGLGAMLLTMIVLLPLMSGTSGSGYGQAVILLGASAVAYAFILFISLPAAIWSWRMSRREPGIETTPAFIGRAMVGLAAVLPFLIYASHA